MILRITHHTRYEYEGSASESHNELRVTPATDERQRRLDFRIVTIPAARTFPYEMPGGIMHSFTIRAPHESLDVTAVSEVETHSLNPFARLNLVHSDWEALALAAHSAEASDMLQDSRYVKVDDQVAELAASIPVTTSVAKWLISLSETIFGMLAYDSDVTNVHSTVQEVLSLRAGVCQDFAHVMIACCRSRGIPARYVSGFLYCSAGEELRGNMATHAWVECMLPDGSWMGIDPTNSVLTNDHHVKVFVGRDYADVTPTRGIYVGPRTRKLDVSVTVERADL